MYIFANYDLRTEKSLKVLDLSRTSNYLDYKALHMIARLCPNLEELVLNNGRFKRKSVKEFARKVKGNFFTLS
jgi:ribosomal protein S2